MSKYNNSAILAIKHLYDELYPNCDRQFEALLSLAEWRATPGQPLWLDAPDNIGISLYVDLYAKNFRGLIDKIDDWLEMGINLIHLLPIQAVPILENDGGYAVSDYREVNPALGNLDDLKAFIKRANSCGIRICIDYVINHTSSQHDWAERALAGEKRYLDYYFWLDDAEEVAQYEAHLPEVFPKVAPGNFSYQSSLDVYIMTTFYSYQWDLNYQNPQVFHEMLAVLFYYAELGIAMIRLDAVPYIWKAVGTDCRNLPEAHKVLSLFRQFMALAYPEVALLGEAIIYPPLIPGYFGQASQPECHILYHASYMVEMWHALMMADARYLELPKDGAEARWIHYARCHDDIGWGLNPVKLAQYGIDQQRRKEDLMAFYKGEWPDSFARGEYYEFDEYLMDARNCGTLASLAGLEVAVESGDQEALYLAVQRITLLFALIIFRRGIAMLYQGEAWALLNDWSYQHDPAKAHDARWLHRTKIDWQSIRDDQGVHRQVNRKLKAMIEQKRTLYRSAIVQEEILHVDKEILTVGQQLADGTAISAVFNLTDGAVQLSAAHLAHRHRAFLMEPYGFIVLSGNN